MKFLSQPRYLLLAISLLLIIYGILTASSTMDIHLHDTYFVVSNFHMGVIVGTFFLLQAAVYFLTQNYRQWRSIQYFHVLSIALIILITRPADPEPFHYADYGRFSSQETLNLILISVFLLGQILFIINILAGFIRGKKVLNRVR